MESKNWTFMLFVNGDNNLENDMIEILDRIELLNLPTEMKIITLFDRRNSGAKIYEITQDDVPSTINSKVLKDLGEVNMGHPKTMLEFMTFAAKKYPADYYGLIIVCHGNSFGFLGPDITSFDDAIEIEELVWVLSRFQRETGILLDIIGFHACQMGSYEVAYALKDYAKIMIASPTEVYGPSWSYPHSFVYLSKNLSMTPKEFARKIVRDSEKKKIGFGFEYNYPPKYFIAVDLSEIDEMVNVYSQLNSLLVRQLQKSPEFLFDLEGIFIEMINGTLVIKTHEQEGIDFYLFIEKLKFLNNPEIREKATKLQTAIAKTIIAKPEKENYPQSFTIDFNVDLDKLLYFVSPTNYKEKFQAKTGYQNLIREIAIMLAKTK